MFTHRKTLAVVGILFAALTLAGCAAPETEGGSSAPSTEGFNDQDVAFAQMMIPHHTQAVEMSDVLLAQDGIDPQVTELAQTIKDAQEPEIKQMNGWLDDWNASADMGGMNHSANGMMSDEEMDALEAASGKDASRLFLEQMIAHHSGAIEMAQVELGEGEYPEATELAEAIIDSQQAEIEQMEELLTTL